MPAMLSTMIHRPSKNKSSHLQNEPYRKLIRTKHSKPQPTAKLVLALQEYKDLYIGSLMQESLDRLA